MSNNQLLIFDGQLLTEFIQPMQAIIEYPKGINENNPVVCFNKVADESYKFPDFSISKYIRCMKTAQVYINKIFQPKIVNIFLPISFNICFGCSKELSH